MSGRLAVIGLGPGDARWLTPEAESALAAADAVYGYGAYLDRVPIRPGQARHPSDNREEGARAAAALAHASKGANVAVVSGGDPGVFAMAAAVCAEIEAGPPAWRALDIAIVPGITAMLAVAARPWQLGAAFDRLGRLLPISTPVIFGRAIGRAAERVDVTTLSAAKSITADMATLVIVGSAETRTVAREGRTPLIYTPRAVAGTSL